MRKSKPSGGGPTLFKVLLPLIVILIIFIAVFFVFIKRDDKTTIVEGDTVRLVGKVTSTTCPSNPDTGCSITVNGYTILIVHGFINTPDLGTVTGYMHSQPLIGKTAHVYAQKVDRHDATIFTNSKYYVHISN
jgi:nucleoside recognition membrane protein YjiH